MKNIKPANINNINERKWLIPYMGDASHLVRATLRHFGIDAKIMETNTPRGYELSKKHIQTEVCQPLKIVTGDILSTLEEKIKKYGKENVEKNYLIALPTAAGPCRFGKYQEMIRIFMDEEGYEKIPLGGPSSTTDYSDILPEKTTLKEKTNFQKILLKSVISADLLDDITLRTRPYSNNKDKVNKLKKEKLEVLENIIESGANTKKIISWAKETAEEFKSHISKKQRFPLIVYSGEIYIRQHDSATENIIEKLEDNGLEVIRNPIIEWVEYVNKTSRIDSLTQIKRDFRHMNLNGIYQNSLKLLRQTIKGEYMHHIKEKIKSPFKSMLSERHVLPEPIKIIKTIEKNNEYHSHIRGESALSIGIAYYIMNSLIPKNKNMISGMFHVGPFTCMQESVATSKIEGMIKELKKSNKNLIFPVVHAYFGDSQNPNIDSEIAVFREQCYQKAKIENSY
ncbi:MAG: hypothetical protein ACP5OG_02735 [Candidatus Nanoarchaeia archaeon]